MDDITILSRFRVCSVTFLQLIINEERGDIKLKYSESLLFFLFLLWCQSVPDVCHQLGYFNFIGGTPILYGKKS